MSGQTSGTVRVLAAVIRRGDRYLLCQRPAQKRHGGLWEFPGGKLEAGEALLDAARRELKEELGVEVSAIGRTLLVVHDEGSPFQIEFVEVEIAGSPSAFEHDEIAWLRRLEITQRNLAPSDRQFVRSCL